MLKTGLIVAVSIILAVLVVVFGCGGQRDGDGADMRSFLPEHIEGWMPEGEPISYDTLGIYDYMDGAGEVYRMYDYRGMIVQRYTKPDIPPITVEIFDMGKPEDAYGVFSHSREKEFTAPGGGAELYAATIVFWKGRYLVSVVAEVESGDTKPAVRIIADAIADQIKSDSPKPALVKALPLRHLQAFSVRFFHLHTSLNYHYYLASENILNLGPNTDAVLGHYQPGDSHVLVVKYESASDATAARESFIENYAPSTKDGFAEIDSGKWIGVVANDNYLIVVLDTPSIEDAIELIEQTEGKIAGINEQERE